MVIETGIDAEMKRQKGEMRLEMKARRALLNESDRARASWMLCLRLMRWLETRPERTIGVYLARPQEISLDLLIADLLRQRYEITAPRVDIMSNTMEFWRLNSLHDLEIGPWNVRQPLPDVRAQEMPLVLVPGLAFDRAGGRLGTGGGWYDRVLGEEQTLVGVGFDCQIAARVPLEAHDCKMNFLCSDSFLLECQ